ncbi:MAG: DUF481 domain-containing protein [Acidiferrobacter sp.]
MLFGPAVAGGMSLGWGVLSAPGGGAPTAIHALPPKPAFGGQVGLGYSATTGLLTTRSIASSDHLHYNRKLWRYELRLSYNYLSTNGVVSADRFVSDLTAERYLSAEKDNFLLAAARYDRNPFDGYRRYVVESVGVGTRLVHSPTMGLKVEGGIGLRQNYYLNGTAANVPVLRAAADYHWHISRKTLFSERFAMLAARTGSLLTWSTGFSSPINGDLAFKLSELVDHYTSAPVGFPQTATFTTVNLIYNIP